MATRIQLDLRDESMPGIRELMRLTGSETYKDLFNNAVTLLRWGVRQRQEGRIITSIDEVKDEYRELEMPALEFCTQLTIENPAVTPQETSTSQILVPKEQAGAVFSNPRETIAVTANMPHRYRCSVRSGD